MTKTELKLTYRETTWYDFDKRMRTQINNIFNSNAQEAIDKMKALSPRGVSDPQDSLAENWVLQQARRQLISSDVAVSIKNKSDNAYAKIFGRPAGGMPPEDPLERWVKSKLFANKQVTKGELKRTTYAIRRHIGLHGTNRWRNDDNPLGLNKDLTVKSTSPIAEMEQNIIKELNELRLQ
jgi:hypothetical protein